METYEILGGKSILSLEVFDTGESVTPGPTIVITAGMDGDELVGIHTARRLISQFVRMKPLCGRVIIIPCVNRPGFEAKTSKNPLDGKYPKHVYPGNAKGTETERIIAFIVSRYMKVADLWIDLHGGATRESLTPFVGGFQTKKRTVNIMTQNILKVTKAPILVYQKNFRWGKVEKLAGHGCSYCIFECGEGGIARAEEIHQIETWVLRALRSLGVIESKKEIISTHSVSYDGVHEYINTRDTWVWSPAVSACDDVAHRQLLGTIRNGTHVKEIRARQDGKVLWHMIRGVVVKHDVLVGLTRNKGY